MKSMALAAIMICAMTSTASAKLLGELGAKSINGRFQLEVTNSSNSESDDSVTSVAIAPNGDLFVAPNLSLGGGLQVIYQSSDSVTATAYGIEGRVGYYLALGASLGAWVQVGGAFQHETFELEGIGESTTDSFALQLYVPLCIHLAPNFFIGIGPIFVQDLYVSDDNDTSGDVDAKERTIGVSTLVGGVW